MFVVMLEITDPSRLGELRDGHERWLARGFADGVFVLSGSMQPGPGGAVVARGTTLAELEARVAEDPFVAEGVARARVVGITPSRTDERLDFLIAG